MTEFAFAVCLPGLETAVKREIARNRPELRFAYSRPGLVTYKAPGPVGPDDTPGTVFARVWGKSLGAAREPDDAAHQLGYLGVTRVHVFARDGEPREPEIDRRSERSEDRRLHSPRGPLAGADLAPWERAVGERLGAPTGAAEPGDLVADVIVAPGEPAWLGLHRHDAAHLPHAGGAIPVDVPADAPSRAYAKIEEAIAWAKLPVEAGQVALEIGAAPGGAALALARRGLDVWGVDTGDLVEHPRIHHLRTRVGALRWEELPPRVDWLLVDVNLAPQVALHEVARLVPPMRASLRGAVITLKLNEWELVDQLPALAERIAQLGFADVQMRHLPSNRREVCAIARSS